MAIHTHHPRLLTRSLSLTHWAERYVGIPFLAEGACFLGCNCWGLVHLILEQEAGIETPSYSEFSASDLIPCARKFVEESNTPTWVSVCPPPKKFDVVLMAAMTEGDRPRRIPGHVGICADPRHVLHVWAKTDAVMMPLDHIRLRHRILGFYRHARLFAR